MLSNCYRIFNILMDLYRNGQVAYEDFKRILSDCEDVCENAIVTGKRPTDKMSFDWQLKAKQQIGFFELKKRKCFQARLFGRYFSIQGNFSNFDLIFLH